MPEPVRHFDGARTAEIDLGDTDEFLDMIGDSHIGISSSTSGGLSATGGWISFDRSEIEQLTDGQILYGVPLSSDNEVVDAAGFEKSAEEFCARFD